jgi:hypothetical protein
LKYIISPKALDARVKANARGFTNVGGVQGDALQLGGVFLISRKDGMFINLFFVCFYSYFFFIRNFVSTFGGICRTSCFS